MYMYYSRYTNNLQESAVIKANTFHRQQSTVNLVIGTPKVPILDSLPLLTIGRLINPYFIIIIVIRKNAKKHHINVAFHNYKIKCTQNQTPIHYNLKWLL